ncbi:MAG: NADP(H)-dependent aldo-keto reductase [Arenicella sp.]
MRYNSLGNTDINVSALCLGTMTFGGQNTESDAFEQLNYAVDQGINFIDTAEMYAIPTSPKTYGVTEEIIGNWFTQINNRHDIVLATKVTGPSRIKHIREGKARLNKTNITEAIEGSLKRLKTDYIDLYQLHWPDRNTNFFGSLSYKHDDNAIETPIEETLDALSDLVNAGKIRAVGLSNETAWGAMKFLHIAEQLNLPRMVSIQNPYNLLNRSLELALAEIVHREGISLLSYSPLAFGSLTGKYINNAQPKNARCTLFKEYKRYFTPSSLQATEKYAAVAQQHNLSLAQMALAFVNQQSFLTSNIIGATSLVQLKENIRSKDILLSEENVLAINDIHSQHTYPSP